MSPKVYYFLAVSCACALFIFFYSRDAANDGRRFSVLSVSHVFGSSGGSLSPGNGSLSGGFVKLKYLIQISKDTFKSAADFGDAAVGRFLPKSRPWAGQRPSVTDGVSNANAGVNNANIADTEAVESSSIADSKKSQDAANSSSRQLSSILLKRYPGVSEATFSSFPSTLDQTPPSNSVKVTSDLVASLLLKHFTAVTSSTESSNKHIPAATGNYSNETIFRNATVKAENQNSPDTMTCKFPELIVDDPSLAPFMKEHATLKCSSMPNWVYTANGSIFIDPKAIKKSGVTPGAVTCFVRDVYRKNDEHWDWREPRKLTLASGPIKQNTEAFSVQCSQSSSSSGGRIWGSSGSKRYRNLHLGMPRYPKVLETPARTRPVADAPSILIYLMDSMSRINTLRKLPKLTALLQDRMGAVILEGFNIVGDGTPWTMIPMLTGHFQPELYEARKRFKNASTVDRWPLLFHDLHKANFVTSYAEEQPQFSFFSYKLKGFDKPPVKHYLRSFEQAIVHLKNQHPAYCLGDTPRSLVLNHWWREMQDLYAPRNIRTFSLLFSSETSHDDYNLVQVMDEHWTRVFGEQYEAGYFNDTFLIVMGDHGRRFGPVRRTQSGKVEEKLPFVALLPPPGWQRAYPRCWANLQANRHRLVTPFDLHATLKALIDFKDADCEEPPQKDVSNKQQNRRKGDVSNRKRDPKGDVSKSNREMSLFRRIPASRTCEQAAIQPHFCSCLQWEAIPANDSEIVAAGQFVTCRFNALLAEPIGKNLCTPLKVGSIAWAKRFVPNRDILAYKASKDIDNIYPDLTASAAVSNVLLQLKFTTVPNQAEYEVSVSYFRDSKTFKLAMSDVQRLNSYSDQPHCIIDAYPELRAYCICPDMVGKAKASLVDKVQK